MNKFVLFCLLTCFIKISNGRRFPSVPSLVGNNTGSEVGEAKIEPKTTEFKVVIPKFLIVEHLQPRILTKEELEEWDKRLKRP